LSERLPGFFQGKTKLHVLAKKALEADVRTDGLLNGGVGAGRKRAEQNGFLVSGICREVFAGARGQRKLLRVEQVAVKAADAGEHIVLRADGSDDPAGIRIAAELTCELLAVEGVRGIHIMSVGWSKAIPRVVEAAGLLPRPPAPDTVTR